MILNLKIECNDEFVDDASKEMLEIILANYDMSLDTDVDTFQNGVLGTISELSNMGAITHVEFSKVEEV